MRRLPGCGSLATWKQAPLRLLVFAWIRTLGFGPFNPVCVLGCLIRTQDFWGLTESLGGTHSRGAGPNLGFRVTTVAKAAAFQLVVIKAGDKALDHQLVQHQLFHFHEHLLWGFLGGVNPPFLMQGKIGRKNRQILFPDPIEVAIGVDPGGVSSAVLICS